MQIHKRINNINTIYFIHIIGKILLFKKEIFSKANLEFNLSKLK